VYAGLFVRANFESVDTFPEAQLLVLLEYT